MNWFWICLPVKHRPPAERGKNAENPKGKTRASSTRLAEFKTAPLWEGPFNARRDRPIESGGHGRVIAGLPLAYFYESGHLEGDRKSEEELSELGELKKKISRTERAADRNPGSGRRRIRLSNF